MFELEGLEVFFYTLPVDMRCSIDGLSIIVSERLSLDPTKGALYVFFNKSQDKLKILYWQTTAEGAVQSSFISWRFNVDVSAIEMAPGWS
jgi:transposase